MGWEWAGMVWSTVGPHGSAIAWEACLVAAYVTLRVVDRERMRPKSTQTAQRLSNVATREASVHANQIPQNTGSLNLGISLSNNSCSIVRPPVAASSAHFAFERAPTRSHPGDGSQITLH